GPGATSGGRPGSCREQATRARPADAVPEPAAPASAITPPIAGAQHAVPGSTPGWPGGLATRASSPRYAGQKAEHTAGNPRCLPATGRQRDRKSERLPRPPTTLRGYGGSPDAVERQVVQIADPRSAGRERPA